MKKTTHKPWKPGHLVFDQDLTLPKEKLGQDNRDLVALVDEVIFNMMKGRKWKPQ